jgi:hypothetical protein
MNKWIIYPFSITANCNSYCCCYWWSGPGAKAPVALQPLGLMYTLLSRSSHCRRQMSKRPMRRERSKQREVELKWARKSSREFCLNADFHVTFRVLLHAVNLRHGTTGFTSPPKEGVLGIFSPWKIRRLRPGLKPRTWVLEANTLTLDHLSRLVSHLTFSYMQGHPDFSVLWLCSQWA